MMQAFISLWLWDLDLLQTFCLHFHQQVPLKQGNRANTGSQEAVILSTVKQYFS